MKEIKSFYKISILIICLGLSFTSLAQMNGGGFGGGNGRGSGHGGRKHAEGQPQFAGKKNVESGPHGGELKDLGKYKIEMLFTPMMKTDPLLFYVLNKKGKTLTDIAVSGTIEIDMQDGAASEKQVLEDMGENTFAAQMSNKTKPFICKLTMIIDGKTFTENFSNNGFSLK